MIFDHNGDRATKIAVLLEAQGLTTGHCQRLSEAPEALRSSKPTVALVVKDPLSVPASDGTGDFSGLAQIAHSLSTSTLAIIETGGDLNEFLDRVRPYDDWVSLAEMARELPLRVAALIGRNKRSAGPLSDPRFLGMIVHDLRTPLNVIVLTIRAIAHSVPQRNPEFDEDLLFLQENAMQTERMLSLLADYCRLIEAQPQIHAVEFNPQRFLQDLLEDRQSRPGLKTAPIRLEIAEGAPTEVTLDPTRARLALLQAISNAITAAGEIPVKMRSSGRSGRWIIELIVEKSPPASVNTVDLRPNLFERLAGSIPERRGFDLAISALISELMGGSARLEVDQGRRTTIVFDWPQRFGQSEAISTDKTL